MKKLDYYIIRKFLGTFFFAIALIIVIVIVFDISEKIDDFLRREAPLRAIVFGYYLNFIPYFVNLFSALFTFISVIFFTSKLAGRSEVIAMLSSGISFKRLLRPYLISASIIALISLILANFVIPPANKKRIEFEDQYFRNTIVNYNRNIHMQISPGTFIYVESYHNLVDQGFLFSLEKFDGLELKYKLMADYIKWQEATKSWSIENYYVRTIDSLYKEKLYSGAYLDTVLNFTPADFSKRVVLVETMNFFELNKFIAKEKMKGTDNVAFYEVEKHKRIAFPMANIVLTLIGVSLSSRKVRGGIGMHFAAGISISFAYILFMQISTTFATFGDLSPALAVWIPNILFGLLSWYLVKKAPK